MPAMSRWFAPSVRKKGWLVVELEKDSASYAHGHTDAGGKTLISFYGRRSVETPSDLLRLAKDLRFSRYQCSTLLSSGDYQLVQVEAPNVPIGERKAALRWKLKGVLDFPIEGATFDVLDIPTGSVAAGRPRSVYAVAARSELIRSCVSRFQGAKIPLSVIDIRETAQRNIGALCEDPERGLALLFVGDDACLLTVNFQQELLLARRIEIGRAQFAAELPARDEAFDRVGLEIQRTLDLVDRQFPFVTVSKLMLAPQPAGSGLAEYLQKNLGVRFESLDLGDIFRFEGEAAPDAEAQWRMFHVLGATLRQ
jgi:MSHA biogenesis protein MshI